MIIMHFIFFLFVSFCISISPLWAHDIEKGSLFDTFVQNLSEADLHFKQIKKIPVLEKNFVSEGKIKFVKGSGFIWEQLKPSGIKFISTTERYCVDNTREKLQRLPYFFQIKH